MPRRLYSLLILCAVPVALAWVLWRGLRERAYWQGLRERLGFGPVLGGPSIWVHGVSLGEVTAAAPLVRELRARYPGTPLVLTTATPTGRARAIALYPQAAARYLPYDTLGAVQRFLRRTRPRLAVIMETELWPNLFEGCRRGGIPVVLANARLSAASVTGYRRLGSLVRAVFSPGVAVAAQTEGDAARFVEIGAAPAQVRVTGNIKFDAAVGTQVVERGRALRRELGETRPIWAAGSTHAGEDEQVLDAHASVLAQHPDALLVLAPRHPERFESVAALIRARGLKFERRSLGAPELPSTAPGAGGPGDSRIGARAQPAPVFLLDTLGELTAFYAASDVVFVGGSLVPIGGHNLLEPAALGLPVLSGPSHANAREVARLLIDEGAAAEVRDGAQLARTLTGLLEDAAARERMGEAGRRIVELNRGAVERVAVLIERVAGATEREVPEARGPRRIRDGEIGR
ncbi:MAG TPA: 3-deoxy-D-manno-octulosonic acid transferase [Steroidobacteraceae bacterium]|jgi:3-deoxy-D-manno-octulosonic-acid transferase|nr:3-deoxy-D-manno-octulosonic acid transferase [Steroidobacteraceae bacterium]